MAEYSPILIIMMVALTVGWMVEEFSSKPFIQAISGPEHLQPAVPHGWCAAALASAQLLDAVARAVPTTTGVLIQFCCMVLLQPS